MSDFQIYAGTYVQLSPDDCTPDQWGIALESPKDGKVSIIFAGETFGEKSVDELYPPTETYLAVIRAWHSQPGQCRSLADVWNDSRIPG